MFKIRPVFLLITFIVTMFSWNIHAFSPDLLSNPALLKLLTGEASNLDDESAKWEFIAEKFIENTKYSKKQVAMLLSTFALSMAGFGVAAYKARQCDPYPSLGVKVFATKDSWCPDISLLYPAVPTAVSLGVLATALKTDIHKDKTFTKKEVGLGALGLYILSWCILNGKPNILSVKTREQLKKEAQGQPGKDADFLTGKWGTVADVINGINSYGILPFIPSTLLAFVTHNLITQYNVRYALKEFLDNYNPDVEKFGIAYRTQCSLEDTDTKNKIEIPNYKCLTPQSLYPIFDEVYGEYMEKGDTILSSASKKVAATLKKMNANVD